MTDIVVVGAGFVGLSFAVAAARQGFTVEVFDRKSRPPGPQQLSSNVLAINPSSARFLEKEEAWQHLPEQFRTPFSSMSVVDGTGSGGIGFTAEEAGVDCLGYIVDQMALLDALCLRAETVTGLTLKWESEAGVEPGDVPLLVGADGVHSQIREKLKLRELGFDYGQKATTCLAELESEHGQCARQWFMADGPLAFLPTSDARRVAVIWSSFEDRATLSDDEFARDLFAASEGCLGNVVTTGPRFSFPLVQQHALQYVSDGVALLGDAAHAIHPLAGQGANLGFADARELVTQLASARLEGFGLSDRRVLKRYEKARMPENQMTALVMEGFHRLFTAKFPWLGLLRSQGLRMFDSNKTLKRLAIGFASR